MLFFSWDISERPLDISSDILAEVSPGHASEVHPVVLSGIFQMFGNEKMPKLSMLLTVQNYGSITPFVKKKTF